MYPYLYTDMDVLVALILKNAPFVVSALIVIYTQYPTLDISGDTQDQNPSEISNKGQVEVDGKFTSLFLLKIFLAYQAGIVAHNM